MVIFGGSTKCLTDLDNEYVETSLDLVILL
jgi:hypothetical protein